MRNGETVKEVGLVSSRMRVVVGEKERRGKGSRGRENGGRSEGGGW